LDQNQLGAWFPLAESTFLIELTVMLHVSQLIGCSRFLMMIKTSVTDLDLLLGVFGKTWNFKRIRFMAKKLFWIETLSSTHVGTGRGLGYIDLPLHREKVTNWPMIPGSTIKGVLADSFQAGTNGRKGNSDKPVIPKRAACFLAMLDFFAYLYAVLVEHSLGVLPS
jgi:hypothetical protein